MTDDADHFLMLGVSCYQHRPAVVTCVGDYFMYFRNKRTCCVYIVDLQPLNLIGHDARHAVRAYDQRFSFLYFGRRRHYSRPPALKLAHKLRIVYDRSQSRDPFSGVEQSGHGFYRPVNAEAEAGGLCKYYFSQIYFTCRKAFLRLFFS